MEMPHKRRSRWQLRDKGEGQNSDDNGDVQAQNTESQTIEPNEAELIPTKRRRCRWEISKTSDQLTSVELHEDNVVGENADQTSHQEHIMSEASQASTSSSAVNIESNVETADISFFELWNDHEHQNDDEGHESGDIEKLMGKNQHAQELRDDVDKCSSASNGIPSTMDDEELESEPSFQISGIDPVADEDSPTRTEFLRLKNFLYAAELSSVSQNTIQRLMSIDPICSRVSYRSLISYAVRGSLLNTSSVSMCANEHVARSGKLKGATNCPTCNGPLSGVSSRRFWFLKPSVALRALLRAPGSFKEMLDGFKRAQEGMNEDKAPEGFHDFYHGNMFRRRFAEVIDNTNELHDEIHVYLSLSTDGFECLKDKRGSPISSWPILCTVLIFNPKERSRAANSLVLGVAPGNHSTDYFDTFLAPIISDLRELEKGVSVVCFDDKIRKLKAFVLYFTADWPAASKVLGYTGHSSAVFCRFCLKRRRHVSQCGSLCALPGCPVSILCKASVGRHNHRRGNVTEIECANRRTSKGILSVWKALSKETCTMNERKAIARTTGIKNNSCLRTLSLDFKYSFPYDVMHLVLLGWCKHLLKLMTGTHPRLFKSGNLPKYCIRLDVVDAIDESIMQCESGIPSSWGRLPLPLKGVGGFKAEDIKRHCEYFLLPFLHRFKVGKKHLKIWRLTSRLVTSCFQYRCDSTTVENLHDVVEELYASFVLQFASTPQDSFCLTPSTHAILHIPELLEQCGPLPITSQFLVERLLGEIGKRMNARSNIATHLFHKNHKLLALRMMHNGIAPRIEKDAFLPFTTLLHQNDFDATRAQSTVLCIGRRVSSNLSSIQMAAVARYLRENHSTTTFEVLGVREFQNAKIHKDGGEFSVESLNSHKRRGRIRRDSRQKYCVAAEFVCDSGCSELSTGSQEIERSMPQTKRDMYYGEIKNI